MDVQKSCRKETGIAKIAVLLFLALSSLCLFGNAGTTVGDPGYQYDYQYAINLSSLPVAFGQEVVLDHSAANNLELVYGDYLSGPGVVGFIGYLTTNVTATIALPKLLPGIYHSSLNTSSGQTVSFEFNVFDDPTMDDFAISTDNGYYVVNETVFITISAPNSTVVFLDIISDHKNSSYNTTVESSTMLMYIPELPGNYTIEGRFSIGSLNATLTKEIIVRDRFACRIDAPDAATMNVTAYFSTQVQGGQGPYLYTWDFGDSSKSSSAAPYHSYNQSGTYYVTLIVRDQVNDFVSCGHSIVVSPPTYGIKLDVVDNSTGNPVGDAEVEIDGIMKKTNVNGRVFFYGLESGRYRISVDREGYERYRLSFDLDSDSGLQLNITPETPDQSLLPEIQILFPVDYTVVDHSDPVNPDLQVEFSLKTDSEVSVCKLLLNEVPFLGYRIADSLENLSSGTYRLSGELSNADYNVKLSCENEFGLVMSDKFKAKGVNYPETAGRAASLQQGSGSQAASDAGAAADGDAGSADAKSADAQEGYEGTLVSAAIKVATERFDKALSELNSSADAIRSYTGEKKRLVEFLGFEKEIEDYRSEIRGLREQAASLERLSIPKSEYNQKRTELMRRMSEIEDKIPSGLSILSEESFVQENAAPLPDEGVSDYLSYKGKNLSEKEMSSYLRLAEDVVDTIKINVDIKIVNVVFQSGKTEEYSMIIKLFEVNENRSGLALVESIPKSVAESINDIMFSFSYELINDDPVVGIPMDGNSEVFYLIKQRLSVDELRKARTLILPDPNHPKNRITGMVVFGTQLSWLSGRTLIISLFAMIVLSTSYLSIYRNDALKNALKARVGSSGAVVKGKHGRNSQVGQASQFSQFSQFSQNSQNSQGMSGIKPGSQEEAEKEAAGSGIWPYATADDSQILALLDKSLDLINSGDREGAFALYPQILSLYGTISADARSEIMPIMSYLGNEIEVYHLISLISRAEEMILSGIYELDGNLNKEIEDAYDEIPDELVSRVAGRYNDFMGLLNMKRFRKDRQIKMSKIGEDGLLAVDNSIYGSRQMD
ncbi:PKD domain-containing protein [Candidatus Woesearchaeota archaeon]|nr:PKD domain-containing protein [Candidatus Woesearchaeota archaeon]